MDIISKLQKLYANESKHSIYQNTPQFIRERLGYTETIDENWRGDSARWEYLRNNFNFNEKSVLDIGANTGFFALSIAYGTPQASVFALEGNENHVRYIETITNYFKMANMHILHQYLGTDEIASLDRFDTVLLFNVLHHAGVDFDQKHMDSEAGLFDYCIQYMGQLAKKCSQVVFQMGYNWGGNKQRPVVPLGEDAGKVIYTAKFMVQADWKIEKVLLPMACTGKPYPAKLYAVHSNIINLLNTRNFDGAENALKAIIDPTTVNMSEFYRRPVFICTC